MTQSMNDFRFDIKAVPVNNEDRIGRFVDDPDLDSYSYSNEVPTNKAFHIMGLCDYTNEHLDCGQQGRYLREYCIQRAGANHFLHLKSLVDLRSVPQHQDHFYIADKLNIEIDLAYHFVAALKTLDFDRKMWLKLYHGALNTPGLKDMDIDQLELTIDFYITLSEEVQDVTVEWENNMVSYNEQIEPENYNDEWANEVQDDGLDVSGSSNPYSTNRLYNGNESLSWEFQQMIQSADEKKLKELKDGMYPTKRSSVEYWRIVMEFKQRYDTIPEDYSSRKRWDIKKQEYVPAVSTGLLYKRPRFHYFTPGMKSHFWRLYKERRKELSQKTLKTEQLSKDAVAAIKWIRSLGKGKATCDLIYSAAQGKSYNLYGIEVKFSTPLHQLEVNTLWNTYRAL